MGPQLEKGAIMACVSNNYDDKGLADMLEQKDIPEKRVGNNFFTDDYAFGCGGEFDYFEKLCKSDPVYGTATCGYA